jgi:ribulose-5-phosphate 4-epimerase/fuculose-1-phosphate aldolase
MDYKRELVRYARIAEKKGLVNAVEGNLSVVDRIRA